MTFGPGLTRLLLACLVFVSHFSSLAIGAPAVAAFFALSGYWIACLWQQQVGSGLCRYRAFMVSRWLRIVPLLFIAILGQGLINATFHLPANAELTLAWWCSQLLVVGSSATGLVLPQQWSLDVEMQFYIIAPLLCLVVRQLPSALGWLFVAGWLALGAWLFHTGTSLTTAVLVPHLGFFLAGVLYQQHRTMPLEKVFRWLPLGVVLALAADPALRLLLSSRYVTGMSPLSVIAAQASLMHVLGIALLPWVLSSVRQRSSQTDRLLGDLAYPIYLFHWWFRALAYHTRPEDASALHKLLDTSAAAAATLVISLLTLLWIDRPIQRWRRSRNTKAHDASAQATRATSEVF